MGTATVRDISPPCTDRHIRVGVVTKDYTNWGGQMYEQSSTGLFSHPYAYYYDGWHYFKHRNQICLSNELSVSLANCTVKYYCEYGHEVHSFVLPKKCGPVSLGVTLK